MFAGYLRQNGVENMYSYIKGIYQGNKNNIIIIEAGGIGYKICATHSAVSKMPEIGMETKVFTYLNVREDAMELYGFCDEEEQELYEILTSVSGVGPKMGISILSYVTPHEFASALISEDTKILTKAPGVGPKLAKRIILELKDKYKGKMPAVPETSVVSELNADRSEAAQALAALGYSVSEAQKAVCGLDGNVEEIISKALKNLMNGR